MKAVSSRWIQGGLSALFVLLLAAPTWARVRAWEGTITIPTYGWSEDVNPKFWALEDRIKLSTTVKAAIVYPYTMQDHLYRVKEDRTYKALFLENEYLKVTCLPELGGQLPDGPTDPGEVLALLDRIGSPATVASAGPGRASSSSAAASRLVSRVTATTRGGEPAPPSRAPSTAASSIDRPPTACTVTIRAPQPATFAAARRTVGGHPEPTGDGLGGVGVVHPQVVHLADLRVDEAGHDLDHRHPVAGELEVERRGQDVESPRGPPGGRRL